MSPGKTLEQAVLNLPQASELYREEFPLVEYRRSLGSLVTMLEARVAWT